MKIKKETNYDYDRLPDPATLEAFNATTSKITNPLPLSTSYLQRKYKLTHEVAHAVIGVLKDLKEKAQNSWTEPQVSLPTLMKPVLVQAKKFKINQETSFEIFVALLDGHSGWVDKETKEPLYVLKWMEIPAEEELASEFPCGEVRASFLKELDLEKK